MTMGRGLSFLLALVPVLGLVELGAHLYFANRAPDFADYADLGRELERLKRPGVPVVVAPAWAEPLVRQAAPKAFPIGELTRVDDSGFSEFLEVSLLGARAEEMAEFQVTAEERVGPFEITRRSNPRATPVLFDFVTALDVGQAEVFVQRGQVRQPCERVERSRTTTGGLHGPVTRPRQRYECDGSVLGVTLIEDQRYRAHRCILVEPVDAADIVLRFNAVPTSRALYGYTGFSYFEARDFEGVVSVALDFRDGTEHLGERLAPSDGTWTKFELARAANPGVLEVMVKRLRSAPADFCFALEAR